MQQSTHLLSSFSEANCKSKVIKSTGVERKEKILLGNEEPVLYWWRYTQVLQGGLITHISFGLFGFPGTSAPYFLWGYFSSFPACWMLTKSSIWEEIGTTVRGISPLLIMSQLVLAVSFTHTDLISVKSKFNKRYLLKLWHLLLCSPRSSQMECF